MIGEKSGESVWADKPEGLVRAIPLGLTYTPLRWSARPPCTLLRFSDKLAWRIFPLFFFNHSLVFALDLHDLQHAKFLTGMVNFYSIAVAQSCIFAQHWNCLKI